jgi:hypothetical protein
MENVTRDVITDLWPLYASGEASPDTRALIEAFLQQDPELREILADSGQESFPHPETPTLTPDHELKTLALIKRRLAGPRWLLLLALVFTATAFGRLISDTSFDVSPRPFVATAVIAACVWVAFLVRLFHGRREVLIRIRR